MDEDKRNPESRSPSPLPSWLEDEALSGQWEGAVGGSNLPLSQTEEGAFLDLDDDWIYDMDEQPSQCGDVTGWEEDMTLQELYQWEEARVQERSQWGAERRTEFYTFEEDVRVRELSQWRDGSHPELHQREENVRVQELYQWEEDGVTYQEFTQWEEHVTVEDLPPRGEEEAYQELSHWREDVRGQELNLRGDQGARELSPSEEELRGQSLSQDYGAPELPQRESEVSPKKLSQWGDDVDDNIWDKPLPPVTAGDHQICPQQGPSSASTVGTEGEGQAAPELPSVAPAPLSPTDTEPAAAAPAGAAEEEEPQGSLIIEETRTEGSPTSGEQVSLAGSHSPSEARQALLDIDQHISSEVPSQAELEIQGSGQQPEEQHYLQQSLAAGMEAVVSIEREESPVPAPQRPCSPCSPIPIVVISQALSEQEKDEEAEGESVLLVHEIKEEALAGEEKDWKYYVEQEISQREDEEDQELTQGVSQGEEHVEQKLSPGQDKGCQLSDWEEYMEEEEPQGESKSYQELSDWEENMEEEQRKGEVKSFQQVSDWEEYMEDEQCRGEVKSFQEESDWEEHIEEEQPRKVKCYLGPPKWEDLIREEFSPGPVSSDERLPNWEDSSMEELSQENLGRYLELLSDWEDSIAQELSQEYNSIAQEFSDWEDYRASRPSNWEDDSDPGLTREDWEYTTVHTIEVKPLRPEEDDWDELSVLELSQGEGREEMMRIFAADGLPVPTPREAWAERRAPAPSTPVPLCASPAQLEAQSPRGAAASPALAEQGAGAGTRSQGPAPQSPCRPPSPSPPQQAVLKRRPSLARRALRALHRLFRSCLGAQPED